MNTCPDGAGSINNPANAQGTPPANPYVAPDFCVGNVDIPKEQDTQQEQYAAENLNFSGAPLNVFKLLGIHEQGKLVDLTGLGQPLNGSDAAFDSTADTWVSTQSGMAVTASPAWLGYDFGTIKTSYGADANAPGQPNAQHITSFRIAQPTNGRRALQVRVERSLGGYKVDPAKIQFSGSGNGSVQCYTPGFASTPGTFMLTANNAASFTVLFMGATTEVVGIASVGVRFNSKQGSFTIVPGSIPFSNNDLFSLPVELDWFRVDVVNLPDSAAAALIRIKQSSPSRYWRLVPTVFSGVVDGNPWEVDKLELFDYQATQLDDIQDQLYMENRDRDYAKQSVQFKVTYQPFDAISDLSKFGFQVADVYSFATVFSTMVRALGRPIVVGDILEVPSEMQYDQNLRQVKKFLEVTDTGWDASGYTSSWRQITFKFQASQVMASAQNRDLLGTVDTQKYLIDDSSMFNGIQQISTGVLTAGEQISADAKIAVPETGANILEVASGTSVSGVPSSYDGRDAYVEDGIPPDGLPYDIGFKLPDVGGVPDGKYFRLEYDPALNIAARLYRFNAVKNMWNLVETDRRQMVTALKPSQRKMFQQTQTLPLSTKKI